MEDAEVARKYAYDARGNLTRVLEDSALKESYTFDAAGRMTAALTSQSKVEYTYNGLLKRVKGLERMHSADGAAKNIPKDPMHEMRYILDMMVVAALATISMMS